MNFVKNKTTSCTNLNKCCNRTATWNTLISNFCELSTLPIPPLYNNIICSCLISKLQEDQAFLLQQILDHFFSEDAIMMLPLSNSKVQEELCNNNTNPSEIKLELLKKAKTDSSIWSEGLDPNYKTFVASLPTSNLLTACLLSILWVNLLFPFPPFFEIYTPLFLSQASKWELVGRTGLFQRILHSPAGRWRWLINTPQIWTLNNNNPMSSLIWHQFFQSWN